MKELIEKLKDKNYVRPFGLMRPEEQECYRKVGKKNCLCYNGDNWCSTSTLFDSFQSTSTYAIKPEYQPEFVDYLIEICEDTDCEEGHFLGVKKKLDNSPILPHEHTYLYCLPSLPNFEEFRYTTRGMTVCNVDLTGVARQISKGKKVYARFRK